MPPPARALALVLTLAGALGGCTAAHEDMTQVVTLATAMGDAPLAACATALAPLTATPPSGAGVLYGAVLTYEARKLFLPGGICDGITAAVAVSAIDKFLPITP